jgi:transcription elongation factor Elf1
MTATGVTDERKIGLSQHRFFCECGNIITAPSVSAYIDEGGIRHVWVCGSCGESFETTIAAINDAGSRGLAAP